MKIKLFEAFNVNKNIEEICNSYEISNYTINDDGSVDVDDDVNLSNYNLIEIPLQFGRVSGYFNCNDNSLTSLKGSPTSVKGTFDCSYNKLTTLEYAPQSIGNNFYCHDNKLTSLKGANLIGGNIFHCSYNRLKTLDFLPLNGKINYVMKHNPIYKWFEQINPSRLELFLDFNIHSDDPDEVNQEKIDMINEN